MAPPSPILKEQLSVSLRALIKNSHKKWAPSSPRTTGQYVGRHSRRREAPMPWQTITILSKNSEFWRDGILEGRWLSSKLLLNFYIKSQLECQMSFQPSPDTARQCAEKNKEGSKRNGQKTPDLAFLPAHWHTPPSPLNGRNVEENYPSDHSLVKAFCPSPLLWQERNSMLFYT